MPYWWCLIHHDVEPDAGCGHKDRLGPYPTRAEAEQALQKAAERTAAWDAVDEEDRDWGPPSGQ